jgi:hypothetical protein
LPPPALQSEAAKAEGAAMADISAITVRTATMRFTLFTVLSPPCFYFFNVD